MCQALENYCQEVLKHVEGGSILSSMHLLRDLKAQLRDKLVLQDDLRCGAASFFAAMVSQEIVNF